MARSIEERMDSVESAIAELRQLPGHMRALASQFVQLRQDLHGEISAMASELGGEFRQDIGALRDEVRAEFADVREEIGSMRTDMAHAILATEERVLTTMRSLHEEVVKGIAVIGQGRADRPDPRNPRKPRKK